MHEGLEMRVAKASGDEFQSGIDIVKGGFDDPYGIWQGCKELGHHDALFGEDNIDTNPAQDIFYYRVAKDQQEAESQNQFREGNWQVNDCFDQTFAPELEPRQAVANRDGKEHDEAGRQTACP